MTFPSVVLQSAARVARAAPPVGTRQRAASRLAAAGDSWQRSPGRCWLRRLRPRRRSSAHARVRKDAPDEPWLEARLGAALAWRATHPLLGETNAARARRGRRPAGARDRATPTGFAARGHAGDAAARAEDRRGARALTGARGAWLRARARPATLFGDARAGRDRGAAGATCRPAPRPEDGVYLDSATRATCSRSWRARALADLFAHSGGFQRGAAGRRASVVAVESPTGAAPARSNARRQAVAADVNAFLRDDAAARPDRGRPPRSRKEARRARGLPRVRT
jgi:hypothetical protein